MRSVDAILQAINLKKVFVMCPKVEARNFYNTGAQRLTQRWQKCVENGGDMEEK
jgi:hypothetical protein